MRIGFITQLLWKRYGNFWLKVFQDSGAEIVFANASAVKAQLETASLKAIPGLAFQLAAAQAKALQDADFIVVPELNHESSAPRGAGQDPWIANFPETLQSEVAGLAATLAVPTHLTNVESLMIEALLSVTHDPAKVKRIWERNQHLTKSKNSRDPSLSSTAVIAQPWLLTDELIKALQTDFGEPFVHQGMLTPELLRQEGQRGEKALIDTDAETLGAARFFARKGRVEKLVFVADKTSASDLWLIERVSRSVHKPLDVLYLQDLSDNVVDVLLHLPENQEEPG